MSGSLNQDKNLNIGSDADETSFDGNIDIKTAIGDMTTDITTIESDITTIENTLASADLDRLYTFGARDLEWGNDEAGSVGAGAGNDTADKFLLNVPQGAWTNYDNPNLVYIGDTQDNRVVLTTRGEAHYGADVVGSFGTGNGQFNLTVGGCAAGNKFWAIDAGNTRVQRFDTTGSYQGQFGGAGYVAGPPGPEVGIGKWPNGGYCAYNPLNNNIYVSTNLTWNSSVQVFDQNDSFLFSFPCGAGTSIVGIACTNDGRVYVVDRSSSSIRVHEADGTFVRAFTPNGFTSPNGLAADPDNDILFMANRFGGPSGRGNWLVIDVYEGSNTQDQTVNTISPYHRPGDSPTFGGAFPAGVAFGRAIEDTEYIDRDATFGGAVYCVNNWNHRMERYRWTTYRESSASVPVDGYSPTGNTIGPSIFLSAALKQQAPPEDSPGYVGATFKTQGLVTLPISDGPTFTGRLSAPSPGFFAITGNQFRGHPVPIAMPWKAGTISEDLTKMNFLRRGWWQAFASIRAVPGVGFTEASFSIGGWQIGRFGIDDLNTPDDPLLTFASIPFRRDGISGGPYTPANIITFFTAGGDLSIEAEWSIRYLGEGQT